MKISVIIPTYNEAENIGALIERIHQYGGVHLQEIIVSDSPNSVDQTIQIAQKLGAKTIKSSRKGRGIQMNAAAKIAQGEILYFVHADTIIHQDFANDIIKALENGIDFGCYRYQFNSSNWLLKINAFCTRFPFIWCRGGDQTLFIRKSDFDKMSGFCENHQIMEDYEFILRAKKELKFGIIPKNVIVSARKYETNSYLRVQKANFKVMRMFLSGRASQQEMVETYRQMLDYR
ncbi:MULTISPECIES: TIGR04283 family arsenosugar biosynthesis glycosyltransferase [Emticicia]|uniref:TIGR04283 family arsenosugar biosynthesis glycosyltransferase n=1 Tax=Emticicia TaxID=312278 RepID=UPI0007D8AF06|nr:MULTISPECIES: TIGR04283 family arsenosugar biosynthesis glycosyltransferase [Emticicia]